MSSKQNDISVFTITGTLYEAPVKNEREGGFTDCNFIIKIAKSKRNEDGTWEDGAATGFARVKCYGHTANRVMKYGDVGCRVTCSGKIDGRSWHDQDGVEKIFTDIVVEKVRFDGLSGSPEAKAPDPEEAASDAQYEADTKEQAKEEDKADEEEKFDPNDVPWE